MKKVNKLVSLVLALVMCLTLAVPAMANEEFTGSVVGTWVTEPNLTPEEAEIYHDIEKMSERELQLYINNIIESINGDNQVGLRSDERSAALDALWYAAAQIAIMGGYECAGTLVQYSVRGQNYAEGNGIFANKIKTTAAFARWRSDPTSRHIEFNNSDNADLYYAIHGASIGVTGTSQGGTAHISDTFDFRYSNLDSLFATLVNNWGALSQSIGVLKPISVHIEISL